jgi:hypothetical protein
MSKKMEKTADMCVEKLLISQKNSFLQECLKRELSEERYNNLIVNPFLKKPEKKDFKTFQKCLFNLETKISDSGSQSSSGSCPEGYALKDNTCQPDKTKKIVSKTQSKSGSCPDGFLLINNSCQPDKETKVKMSKKITSSKEGGYKKKKYNLNDPALNKCFKKMLGEERYQEVIVSGSQKPNDQENKSITGCQKDPDFWSAESNSLGNDPALNKCFKKMLGEERYQEVIVSGSQKPNDQENKSITGCQKDPDFWSAESFALGYNTPNYYYDIFDGNKIEDCTSNPNPVFTHEITDFSKIKRLLRWGLTPQGYLKNHTYVALKNKGHSNNRVIIKKPVPVYAPIDSYLILQSRYRMQGLKDVQWRLMFQVSCEILYRFDHLDTPSDRILKHLGNVIVDEDQISAPNLNVKPPLKIKAGEIIAYTKGTPQGGTWDFGVVDINKNNELPKRLKEYENRPTGRQYKYAACPYDYYNKEIKKKYLKKMKGKKCNPKEIK